MKRHNGLKFGITAGVCVALSLVMPALATPGTESDPLISQSYITSTVMPQLEEYIREEVAKQAGNTTAGTTGSSSESFEVVKLDKGDKLVCENGTELILRMGTATIIASEAGGIADVTIGTDLAEGTQMPSNHHLIVPLSDGRGIKATSSVLVMVKGGYRIR